MSLQLTHRRRMKSDVLVVMPHHSSFIDQDVRILQSRFDVSTFLYDQPSNRFGLLRALRRCRVAIAWFVLGYAYAMVRFKAVHRIPCLLIAGGWDVEALPELGYGEMRTARKAARTSFALERADRVLAVSQFTLDRVRHWAPGANSSILYHGFDDRVFQPGTGDREGVVTVSRVAPETWSLKGLSTFVEVARKLPAIPFSIVGDSSRADRLLDHLPDNVQVIGPVTQVKLAEIFGRARLYAQLSAVESFCCSLAESMLCGCVPVVANRGALPEVIGNQGRIVPHGDVGRTVAAVREIYSNPDGNAARARIQACYPLNRREQNLKMEISQLLSGGP